MENDWSTMYSDKQQIIVATALIKHDEKILLQKRIDPEPHWAYGKWEFPGGQVEYGESPEQALVREVKEEIGCDISIIRLLPHVNTKTIDYDGTGIQVFVLVYECRLAIGNEPEVANEEISRVQWFARDEILKLDTLPGIKDFLEHA